MLSMYNFYAEPARRLVPILFRSGLYLEPFRHGDEARFARVFADTWRRIPYRDRRRMIAYWRTDSPARRYGLSQGFGGDDRWAIQSPRVQLLHGWAKPSEDLVHDNPPPDHVQVDRGKTIFAAVYCKGFLLRFWSKLFDALADPLAAHLIAHELAHVVLDSYPGNDTLSKPEHEEYADELTADWGFGEPAEFDRGAYDAGFGRLTEASAP